MNPNKRWLLSRVATSIVTSRLAALISSIGRSTTENDQYVPGLIALLGPVAMMIVFFIIGASQNFRDRMISAASITIVIIALGLGWLLSYL